LKISQKGLKNMCEECPIKTRLPSNIQYQHNVLFVMHMGTSYV
jgi:hypothetical protein